MANAICYGDTVYIDFDDLILFTNGFFDPTLYLINCQNMGTKSFRNGLFKIFPNLSHKDTSHVDELEHQLDLLKSLNSEETFAAQQLEKDIQQERKILEERETRLEELNDKIYAESKGKPLRYGNKVQLKHIESQLFLGVSKKFHKEEKTLSHLELTKKSSKDLYFTVMPKLAFNQEGEEVEYGTPIKLVSFKTGTALSKGPELNLETVRVELNKETKVTGDSSDMPAVPQRRKEPLFESSKIYHTGVRMMDSPETTYIRKFLSYEEEEKAEIKKALKNGDYIRIMSDKLYFSVFKRANKNAAFFQGFNSQMDYRYNRVATLFQILEIKETGTEEEKPEKEKAKTLSLPQGNLLEYDETKRYILKHVASGRFMGCKEGKLELQDPTEDVKSLQKISILIKGKANINSTENYIDRSDVMQFKFYSADGEELGIFTIGQPIKIPNVQLEVNTWYYYGFERPENYLNKFLRTERHGADVNKSVDEQYSSFKVLVPSIQEIVSTFLVESFTNSVQKFLDFLDELMFKSKWTLKDFNDEVKKILDVCAVFAKQLYEDGQNETSEEILVPDSIRQGLLREYQTYDLLYRVFFYFAEESSLKDRFETFKKVTPPPKEEKKEDKKEEEEKKDGENKEGELVKEKAPEETPAVEPAQEEVKEIDIKSEVNYPEAIKLLTALNKIILVSFKKNDLSHFYCSQFVRIPINCCLNVNPGIFALSSHKERISMKELVLRLVKEGLWDKDLDALGQLNFYETALFDALEQQQSYHSIYLRMLIHISNSKAPNLQNTIRDNFIFNYLGKSLNMSHVFPGIEDEEGKLSLQFKRRKCKEENTQICVNEISAKAPENSQEETLMKYFLESLELAFSLTSINSSMYELKIVRYYPYDNLVKISNLLKDIPRYRQVRGAITELITKVHQNYLRPLFSKLPNQVQILDHEERLRASATQINRSIKSATESILSPGELEYIKEEEIESLIEDLKSKVTTENQANDIMKILDGSLPLDQPEVVENILEEVQKVLESNQELSFDFFKKARELVLGALYQTIQKKGKEYFDIVKQSLEVFSLVEQKSLAFAATDIITVLKDQNLLTGGGSRSPKKKTTRKLDSPLSPESDRDYSEMVNLNNSPQKELVKQPPTKVNPETVVMRELSSNNNFNASLLPTVIETCVRQWKTGERFLGDLNDASYKLREAEKAFKNMSLIQILNVLLEIFLLNQEHLQSNIIQQLKRVSSFENLLYKELNRLTILFDQESLEKTAELIRITFRLNDISREIYFRKDNLLTLEQDDLKKILDEVLELQWSLFFIIYDPSLHFRYNSSITDPKQRFKEAFLKVKKPRWDIVFKLRTEAINKSFQKIFHILKTYKVLVDTQDWVLDKKTGFDDSFLVHGYIIRLNVLILSAFVQGNKENQVLFSSLKGTIRKFYNQHFLNQTPDAMLIFAEIMRDNKKLLKLPTKYLYDITMSTFVGTMGRSINNNETNGYLCAGIGSLHYLSKALIPLELYNPISDMNTKWGQIADTESFTKLRIPDSSNSSEESEKQGYSAPFCYYSIRGLMEETLAAVEAFSSHQYFHDIQLFLGFKDWLNFFQSQNYLLQYELKNLAARCISKIYFEHKTKHKFIQENDECMNMIACLSADIIYYRDFRNKKLEIPHELLTDNKAKSENFMVNSEKYTKVQDYYKEAAGLDLEKLSIEICGEAIMIENLLTEYIYDGCLGLLFSIVLQEVEFCKETRDVYSDIQSIVDFLLALLEDLITTENDNALFPFEKIEEFLTKMSVINGYTKYKKKILANTNLLYSYKKTKDIAKIEKKKKEVIREITPLESYLSHISNLQNLRKIYKEQNIKQAADVIADHPKSKLIIKGILNYLKKDPVKLDHEEIIFILKLLRKYIERENTNNPDDDPVYLWQETSLSDLKKIEKIQQAYRNDGLSDILFTFFGINDTKIFRETMLLSLAYMYGGNKDVQRDFQKRFVADDENRVVIQLRDHLKDCWEHFRTKETKRIQYLYATVQKSMFDYFKGKKDEKEIDVQEMQIRVLQATVDPEHLEPAEKSRENQLFIQVLTFLQALCEGQFTTMQIFLREQRGEDGRLHSRSFDFLSFLRHSTNTYYKVMSRYNLSVGNKIVDLITELVQGEVYENIVVFLYKTFIYDMCRILTDFNTRYHTLPRGFGMNVFHKDFREFKGKVIFLFKTILENRNEANNRTLSAHLDLVGLMRVMESLMTEFIRQNSLESEIRDVKRFIFSLTNEDFKGTLGDAINIYIIYRYIWEDIGEFNQFNERMRELIKSMEVSKQDFMDRIIFTIFPKLVNSIEIIGETKDNSISRIWFPVVAVCHYLNKDTQNSFLKHVDRSNSQTKISALIDSSQEFVPQMYAEYHARNRIFGFNLNNFYYGLRFITNLLGLAITIINIATHSWESGEDTQEDTFTNITLGLNIAQIALAGLLILLWWSLLRKRHLSLMWERYVDSNIKTIGLLPPTIKNKLDEGDHKDLNADECLMIMKLKGANSDEFQEMKRLSKNFKKIRLNYYLLKSMFVVKSNAFLWHLIYMAVTVGSIFHPLVAIFQIFDIAVRSDTILQIYASISRNANQFVWTLFLLVLTNILYSSIGFYFLNDYFVDGNGDSLCETSFACFLNVLNLGLRSGGGIADIIKAQPFLEDKVGLFIGRAVFDLSFFIIMIILLLNLIFGMIIDAFGELRDEKTRNEEDQKNVCFICGIQRSEFERHANFEEHSLEDHNIWAYVFYIVYLLDKQKTERNSMTGVERLVLEKYLMKNYEWIPIGKSLRLEKIYELEKMNKEDEFDVLANKVNRIQENIEEVSNQLKTTLFGQFGETINNINEKVELLMKKK